MISYGGVDLHLPVMEEAAWIESQTPPQEVFSFWHPRNLSISPSLNPRIHFAWWLQRPFKVNCYFCPWGASRWSYAFLLADGKMIKAIRELTQADARYQNSLPLDLVIDDDLGNSITTSLFMLPPVPLSKVMNVNPQLPLWLVPLVDQRYFWWERAAIITINEGVTTWTQLYAMIAAGLNIGGISADPISANYLKPGAAFSEKYEYLPMLLDWAAASCGQRIVRRLDDSILALNSQTSISLMIAQVNQNRKYAGGTLELGIVDG